MNLYNTKACSQGLVPDTPCSMMRHRLLPSSLKLFHLVVEEEVNQDGVDMCFRMLSPDLSLYQFYTPYTTSYAGLATHSLSLQTSSLTTQLHLPFPTAFETLPVLYRSCHGWATVQRTQRNENLWYSIVGEDGDFVDVVEFTIGLSVKTSPEIGDKNLRTLQKTGSLAVLPSMYIAEALKVFGQNVDQLSS